MRAVVQRISSASVSVENEICGKIDQGLLVYLGVMKEDTLFDADHIIKKICNLRIFEDSEGRMNLSALQQKYEILIVSQFTICGNVIRGNRPSFDPAAPPELALKYYNYVIDKIRERGLSVQTGIFQANMEVTSLNDGPVTILIDSGKTF